MITGYHSRPTASRYTDTYTDDCTGTCSYDSDDEQPCMYILTDSIYMLADVYPDSGKDNSDDEIVRRVPFYLFYLKRTDPHRCGPVLGVVNLPVSFCFRKRLRCDRKGVGLRMRLSK